MKHIIRILVAVITFFIAINITWAIYYVVSQETFNSGYHIRCDKFCVLPKLRKIAGLNPQKEVEVRFIEFVESEDRIYAKIEVVNNSPDSIYYHAYGFGENGLPLFKLNNLTEKVNAICGTGLSTFHLHSGESMTNKVYVSEFSSKINKETNLQIGCFYSSENQKKAKVHWSQKFEASNTLLEKVKEHKIIFH